MKNHKLSWVDVFTTRPFNGNPCAVVFDADDLSEQQMQVVAKEMNLSETAFILASKTADFRARYFTPVEELPLAGHPTIAVIQALIEDRQIKLNDTTTSIKLELNVGDINIRILNSEMPQIFMEQIKPVFLTEHCREKISILFGLDENDLMENVPVQTVSTGTPQLMVAVKNHEILKKATMNTDAYKNYHAQSDFSSPHLFCLGGVTADGDTFARHLGVYPDTLEDPFTGSATGAMAAFLTKYELIRKSAFIAEQGHWMGRPGSAQVKIISNNGTIEKVIVGGNAVIILKGHISI